MRYTRFLLIVLGALVFLPLVAQAQAQLEIFDKELPVYELLDEETYAAQSTLFEKIPFDDKTLAYEIRLPSDWVESKSFGYSLSTHVMVEIGKYTGPVKFNKESSHLIIQAQELDYRTSAKECFTSQVWRNGYSIMGAKEHNKSLVEALHVELQDGETYVVRTLTMINGNRLIQVMYYLPSTSWEEEKVMQNQIVNSFKLINPDIQSTEALTTYEFLDVVSVEYPSSWEFIPAKERSLDFLSAQAVHYDPYVVQGQKQIVNGRIRMMMYSHFIAKSMEEEMANHLEALSEQGIVVQGHRETDMTFKLPPEFDASRVELYDILDGEYPERETELWLVGMESGEYYYVVSLLTPSKASNFGLWTRNMEVLKIILGSFDSSISKR
jgi:hypothetical protein